MAYTRGTSNNIIVGAAALFTYEDGVLPEAGVLPGYSAGVSYKTTLSDEEGFRNVGYTMNGLELQFQPDFGEVQVDQLLDVAKLYKQGMQVNLNTAFAEATLENLLVAIAAPTGDLVNNVKADNPLEFNLSSGVSVVDAMELSSGQIGECPVERGIVAVGPGTGDCEVGSSIERIYVAFRALSIENVTVSAKRDEASMFEVSFRLLPASTGSYGRIVDRLVPTS